MSARPADEANTLTRAGSPELEPSPVRIVHLGLGNFFRAHAAWYTHHAPGRWGIAAFTGRSDGAARALRPQEGLYTLITRHGDRDRCEVVGSVTAVHPAADHASWLDYFRSPDLAVVTLTVTEAGYRHLSGGGLDTGDHQVRADAERLRRDPVAPAASVPARLLTGLVARERAGLGPVTVVPCDNLPHNGSTVRAVVRDMAALVDPELVPVVDRAARYATTMVDRITPDATVEERERVLARTGVLDASPVVTEPFTQWVISGDFPAGRPEWESVGAVVTDDVAPYEQCKLSLLNGGHSLLAYAGSTRGHTTVADAVGDETCLGWLREWWGEARSHLVLPEHEVDSYLTALLERWSNPRMRHRLEQIAADGSLKLPVRILPTLRPERALGRLPQGAARTLASWVCHLRGLGAPVSDPRSQEAREAASGPLAEAVPRVLALLDTPLAHDAALVDAVAHHVHELSASPHANSPV
ncbi:mannitol dehydrogenase family protein [Nocardiopsis nanhaiensis]